MDVPIFEPGRHRYIKAVFQYSGGVAAEPGYEIERARFAKPLRLADAYAAVEAHLKALGRPATAFAACELRSPVQFTEQGWKDAVTTQAYTVQNIGHLVGEVIAAGGAASGGLVWTYARPPVEGLEFEMDVRGAAREIVL
jgi:hypothetical protein